ncbi:CopD family protein [Roseateles sp.]|uniref:CopD family protein n=1 Tax=Roseateles sp. TaxID=1971397 RepID=UPI00286A03DC|nr:CopD family protein [Roseateles sp.]
MIYATLKTLHLLAIVVWLGGMSFSVFFLRPATAQLDAAQRVRLMHAALGRFFKVSLWASLLVLGSGVWMLGRVAKQVVQSGGVFQMPLAWTVMAVLGSVMVASFLHIKFALYKKLSGCVVASDWHAGDQALNQIHNWLGVNLSLGVLVLSVTLLR